MKNNGQELARTDKNGQEKKKNGKNIYKCININKHYNHL